MKFDIEVAKKTLEIVESKDDRFDYITLESLHPTDERDVIYCDAPTLFHCMVMIDDGLIKGHRHPVDTYGGQAYDVYYLTMKGNAFLETLRNDTILEKMKKVAKELSLSVLVSLSQKLALDMTFGSGQ
jgi:hypothetical protein